jgi:hypothetical protein
MALLDLFSVSLEEQAASNSQPENWTVAPSFLEQQPAVLRTCHGKRTVEFLLSHAEIGETILRSTTDSLHADAMAQDALSQSLCLIRPADLSWKVSHHANHPGKLQVRAQFRYGGAHYSLVVTDPVWEAKCHHLGVGVHPHTDLAAANHDLVFLSISLAAVPFHGLHYKLVAGVIELDSFGLAR